MRTLMTGILLVVMGGATAMADTGTAVIRGTTDDSTVEGGATLTDTEEGLKISVTVSHVPPGTHGLHIHEFGDCGDHGNAAGVHYNPHEVKHGFLPTDGVTGAHAGDLGNIEVAKDGTGRLNLTIPELRVSGGEHTVGGRAVILHEKTDDFGQPTGNAGGRIGCGTIVITQP